MKYYNFRFIAVWFPVQLKVVSTKKNVKLAMLVTFVVIATVCGYWCSWADQIVDGTCRPNYRSPENEKLLAVFLVFGTSIYAFVPSILLSVLNILIVAKLRKIRKRVQIKSKLGHTDKRNSRLIKTTSLLLGISIAFILLVSPNTLVHVTCYITQTSIYETTNYWLVLFREISSVLEQTNNSINFFVYVLCSPKFRDQLAEIVNRLRCNSHMGRLALLRNTSHLVNNDSVTAAYKQRTEVYRAKY